MISGKPTLIAHIGYPTESLKAPFIYNPWFDSKGIDAVVVPMGCKPDNYPAFLKSLFRLTNIRGALVTMPLMAPVVTPCAAAGAAGQSSVQSARRAAVLPTSHTVVFTQLIESLPGKGCEGNRTSAESTKVK